MIRRRAGLAASQSRPTPEAALIRLCGAGRSGTRMTGSPPGQSVPHSTQPVKRADRAEGARRRANGPPGPERGAGRAPRDLAEGELPHAADRPIAPRLDMSRAIIRGPGRAGCQGQGMLAAPLGGGPRSSLERGPAGCRWRMRLSSGACWPSARARARQRGRSLRQMMRRPRRLRCSGMRIRSGRRIRARQRASRVPARSGPRHTRRCRVRRGRHAPKS